MSYNRREPHRKNNGAKTSYSDWRLESDGIPVPARHIPHWITSLPCPSREEMPAYIELAEFLGRTLRELLTDMGYTIPHDVVRIYDYPLS